MESFIFASNDNLKLKDFGSLISFSDKFGDEFYEVVLNTEKELQILFRLLGIERPAEVQLSNSEDFYKIFDCASFELPELSPEEFDNFYNDWLMKTGRESNMDKYGQLIFIQGQASKWNRNSNRVVLHAKP